MDAFCSLSGRESQIQELGEGRGQGLGLQGFWLRVREVVDLELGIKRDFRLRVMCLAFGLKCVEV